MLYLKVINDWLHKIRIPSFTGPSIASVSKCIGTGRPGRCHPAIHATTDMICLEVC